MLFLLWNKFGCALVDFVKSQIDVVDRTPIDFQIFSTDSIIFPKKKIRKKKALRVWK